MRYSDEDRERVRDAVDFVALVGAKTELRRAGGDHMEGLCPFHEERTPSFGISPTKKVYHCFGCGAGGDVFRFVQETEGLDFVGALETLAERAGIELAPGEEDPRAAAKRAERERLYELLGRATEFYVRQLWESREAEKAREYLVLRGLTEESLREFKVGYAPSRWDTLFTAATRQGYQARELYDAGLVQRAKDGGRLYDRFRTRIMFPISDARGRVVGFGGRAMSSEERAKYLNSPESPMFDKRRLLYGLTQSRSNMREEALVAEGYTDVIALHQAGLKNAVAIMGTSLTEQQVEELSRVTPRVALALDADNAGKDAMLRAARVAAGRKLELRVVPMPLGVDPADLVTGEGPDAMRALVAQSIAFERFHVDRILETADLGEASGRDRAMGELRAVLSAMPASAAREELVRVVAGRLGVSDELASTLTTGPGPSLNAQGGASAGRPAPGLGGKGGEAPSRGGQGSAGAALDRREKMERTVLALCAAFPERGAQALAGMDLDTLFTSAIARRAAEHLRRNIVDPLADAPVDDPELQALLAEIVIRVESGRGTQESLTVELLQLDLERIDREMAASRAAETLTVSTLAQERSKVQAELDGAMDRASAVGASEE